eukprot:2560126-Pyramimonas_sp.AAC.1
MRANICWTSTTTLACKRGQGLCYTAERDEPIDLVALASLSENEVVVETCKQELFNYGLTEKQIQDLPAGVNAARPQ